MNEAYLLSEKEIRRVIDEDEDLSIFEETEDGLSVIDDAEGKDITVHFLENMNAKRLADLIHISPDIPNEYQVNKDILADYLWNVCDKNAFVTLTEMVIIWNPEGESYDAALERLYEEYYDETARELSSDYLGQLWYDRNIVAVNLGRIVKTAAEIAQENEDCYSSFFRFDSQVIQGFLTTASHELRHLQMDTNVFLPEEIYPMSLGSEDAVEDYCREVFEDNPIPLHIIDFHDTLEKHRSLDDQIQSAGARASEKHSVSAAKAKEPIPNH